MLSEDRLVETITDLALRDLSAWVESGWVQPERRDGRRYYREIDIARVHLIREIRQDMNVQFEDIPLVLSLIDQIHGLRSQLKKLASAVDAQPDTVKKGILDHMKTDKTNR